MNRNTVNVNEVQYSVSDERFFKGEDLFSGVCVVTKNDITRRIFQVSNGLMWGGCREYDDSGKLTSICAYDDVKHGYQIEYLAFGHRFAVFFEGEVVEGITVDERSGTMDRFKNEQMKIHEDRTGFGYFYALQEELGQRVITENELGVVTYVAGADVAYNETAQRMAGALVVLDVRTLEVVDQAVHEMEITFPYVPGLFSFREVPPLLEAYRKLKIKPDLIVCDGHGVAHPKGAGLASHLGIELDVPTIGCAKNKLIGAYQGLGDDRGAYASLMVGEKEIGRVLRTQKHIKPMFVSIGHKVSLDAACDWVLKLCPKYRQPETTRKANELANEILKERTNIGYPEE
jgi:deoxyribonuclease V